MVKLQILEGLKVDYSEDGWAEFKKWLDGTYAKLLFAYADNGSAYEITAVDGKVYRYFAINKTDATDFEANFKSKANAPVTVGGLTDPRMIRRFGNLTSTATAEVLLAGRAYVEQAAQAQRSVVSTSNQDKAGGTGSVAVRITFLNSAFELKTEDVTLNGTAAVNTVATDIRFIEKFQVIQGTFAVGALKIMTATGGGGSEFCGIGAGTTDAFLCHHYVPAGKSGYVYGWSGCTSDDVKFLAEACTASMSSMSTGTCVICLASRGREWWSSRKV
jgi:hypothetical protein